MPLALWKVSLFCLDQACWEILAISGSYTRKPDCFRRAAGRIRVRCAEIDMDADQRVKGMCITRIYATHHHRPRIQPRSL
jgi:hypothetical protein